MVTEKRVPSLCASSTYYPAYHILLDVTFQNGKWDNWTDVEHVDERFLCVITCV